MSDQTKRFFLDKRSTGARPNKAANTKLATLSTQPTMAHNHYYLILLPYYSIGSNSKIKKNTTTTRTNRT